MIFENGPCRARNPPEILHRRIDELLDILWKPVYLVNEEHIAILKIRENPHEIGDTGKRGPDVVTRRDSIS